jgi:RAB protein geranylgeranyltransferase component A
VNFTHPSFWGYLKDKSMTVDRAIEESRKFSIDLSCRVMLSSGLFIDSMINSGVGRYLEFKAIDKLFYCSRNSLSELPTIFPVPCSKGDVFNSNLYLHFYIYLPHLIIH